MRVTVESVAIVNGEANARRIVSVPEMLEFIEIMAEMHDGKCYENQENLGRCRCHVPRAVAILAKAKGE